MINFSPEWMISFGLKLSGFKSQYLSTTWGKLHYYTKKASPEKGVVVCVHGIGASAGHYGAILSQLHRLGYTVYAPDLPEHGKSLGFKSFTPEEFYQSFVEWTKQVLPEKFILIGNSMGGAISLRFAADFPQRVGRLILISPAGGFQTKEEWEEFKKTLDFRSVADSKKYIDNIYHKAPFYNFFFYRPFFDFMQKESIQKLLKETQFEEISRNLKTLSPELGPTLLIWGKSEKILPSSHLKWFKESAPSQVTFEEPQDLGHCPQIENPKWFLQRISQFIETGRS